MGSVSVDVSSDHQQISFAIEAIDSGFKITSSMKEEQYTVLNTNFSQAIIGVTCSIHVIRSNHPIENGTLTQMDAFVVDPDTRQFHSFPMFRLS
jgi:ribosomal protein L31